MRSCRHAFFLLLAALLSGLGNPSGRALAADPVLVDRFRREAVAV